MDLSFISSVFFDAGLKDEIEINSGHCFYWAYVAKKLHPSGQLYGTQVHAFIEIDGLFYDAERPKGVKNWKTLPIFSDFPEGLAWFERLSVRQFFKFWADMDSDYANYFVQAVENIRKVA